MTLENRIGYTFRQAALLRQALSHPSLGKKLNNQRLEFLGDAVLGLVVARMVFSLFPGESEGDLARRHAALVRGETIGQIGVELGLGEALLMAASEEAAGGRQNAANLEDACEALIGAMYLDGGLEAVEKFITHHWQKLAQSAAAPPKDAKTALQEWAQARGLAVPDYVVVESTGPAHAPVFTIEVQLEGQEPTRASAASKRAAEQAAAGMMLERL